MHVTLTLEFDLGVIVFHCVSRSTMTSSSARRLGRPPIHVLHTQSSSFPAQQVDIGLYPSQDGRRVILDAPSPPRKKRRGIQPSDLEDNFAHWDPGEGGDDGEGGAYSGDEGYNGPSAVVADLEPLTTRTRYLSSVSLSILLGASYKLNYGVQDYPMLAWRQGHITEFLREMLRHDGLGEHRHSATCATCREPIGIPSQSNEVLPDTISGLTRCQDCCGDCIECAPCCLQRHARLPLHRTEVRFIVPHV